MKASIQAGRAVGAEFARRKFTLILLIFAIIAVILIGLIVWLVNISAWWWLLGAPVIILMFVSALALLVLRLAIKIVAPRMAQAQRTAIKDFVDKLERVADNVQTPLPFIVVRIVWDAIWVKEQTFIRSMVKDGTTLHSDFIALQKLFMEPRSKL